MGSQQPTPSPLQLLIELLGETDYQALVALFSDPVPTNLSFKAILQLIENLGGIVKEDKPNKTWKMAIKAPGEKPKILVATNSKIASEDLIKDLRDALESCGIDREWLERSGQGRSS